MDDNAEDVYFIGNLIIQLPPMQTVIHSFVRRFNHIVQKELGPFKFKPTTESVDFTSAIEGRIQNFQTISQR
jgi:hypothetical protein